MSESSNLYIITSPRSGSTATYLALLATTQALFFPNALGASEAPNFGRFLYRNHSRLRYSGSLRNEFGKTPGLWSPSEGSAVFSVFFGGSHPSATLSRVFRPGQRERFRAQLAILAKLGTPLVTKNPWNSFRVQAIMRADPSANFLWVKRDIFAAAASELVSRKSHGDLYRWSSATPANYEVLSSERPAVQALEQHVEYSKSIANQFKSVNPEQRYAVHYEEILRRPVEKIQEICDHFLLRLRPEKVRKLENIRGQKQRSLTGVNDDLARELAVLEEVKGTTTRYLDFQY